MIILAVCLFALVLFIVVEILVIKHNGTPVSKPSVPRIPQSFGKGSDLTYVVMGDSTSVAEGAKYKDGYALATAKHLAQNHRVKFVNVGVSGATAKSVLEDQTALAIIHKPDLVLLAVGANDATHFTRSHEIQRSIQKIVDELKLVNCNVRIVVTRSPAMDSVSRFPWGAKQVMGLRTRQVNKAFEPIIQKNDLTIAPIAEETRQAFLKDPTLTASDNFHPNARGYALWTPVINKALDHALAKPKPADCE